MHRLIEQLLRWWMQRTKEQQLFLWYVLIFLVVLFVLPVFHIQDLDAVEAKRVWFFGSWMTRLQIAIVVICGKLALINSSAKRKKAAYRILWWNNNEHMDNAVLLGSLLIIFLSVSETIGFYGQQISTIVTPTRWLLCIELLLLWWVVWQLMITRLQRKKTAQKTQTSQSTKVPYEVDVSKKSDIFSSTSNHMDTKLEGLFGKDE